MSKIYLNDSWQFSPQFDEKYFDTDYSSDMLEVRIPHSCTEVPYNHFSENIYQMLSVYRKSVFAPDSWRGKRILLTFEGIGHYAEVHLGGKLIGTHSCGYTAFTLDISNALVYNTENSLLVKVDSRENLNIPPFGNVIDYMTFGGIYRDVYIEVKEPAYIEDVFAEATFSGKISSEVTICGDAPDLTVRQSAILNGHRFPLCEGKSAEHSSCRIDAFIESVIPWDIDSPTLYTVETELLSAGVVIDTHTVKVGFRDAEFRADGFYLNGKYIKIRGLDRHQSYPYIGYAAPKSLQESDADIMKYELGLNAVRTSHYPQSQYFIDRCDEIGLLVFTEIPGWQHIGDSSWQNQAVKNVEEMVLQYRNHPSIVLWGVRINESPDNDDLYTRTNETARALDPTRPTGGVRNIMKSSFLEDVYTYNDFVHNGILPGCRAKSEVTPDISRPYLISEYGGHMFPTKSFDSEEHRLEHALRHARVLNDVASHEDICGSFGWCLFDYNTHRDFGSGDRICYHGVTDMFRNPKLAAAVYSSQQDDYPVLEVSSSMDIGEHPESKKGRVWIFTNADSVRMYKNGIFIKEYFPEHGAYPNMKKSPILIDDYVGNQLVDAEGFDKEKSDYISYAINYIELNDTSIPSDEFNRILSISSEKYGIGEAELYALHGKYMGDWGASSRIYRFDAIKDGKTVKSVTKAPADSVHLECTVSSETLSEETGYDMSCIRIRALDEYGNTLPFYSEALTLSSEGPIEIVGPRAISLKGGMGGTYVKSIGIAGEATITIRNYQLSPVTIKFKITV